MVRMINSALALVAISAMILVGCGQEDVTDLEDQWMTQENDLNTKLTEVSNKIGQIESDLTTTPAAMSTDSNVAAQRDMIQQTVAGYQSQIAEVQETINSLKTKREEARAGSRADYEAAMSAAKVEYEGAMAKLNEIESGLSAIDVNSLNDVEADDTMLEDAADEPAADAPAATDAPEEPADEPVDTTSN